MKLKDSVDEWLIAKEIEKCICKDNADLFIYGRGNG